MLQLKAITKSYKTGDFIQNALHNVSLKFRQNEFVAILGQSGSGKTTMLNIIGGLDRYDSGDLIINGASTKKYKNKDWDAYRNNSVGFIFQSYNLITHISVLQNVEMGMTLSGVSSKERTRRALEVLERVGLKEHAKKKPNQLSGGQMQRVAIARALANNPDIILADEPTGALDSQTSLQIMELIREISKDKLVIMVTHNPELAQKYATRTVMLSDGQVVSDSNPIGEDEDLNGDYRLKKTAMSFFTALRLSFNNILTKKGRTILTAFASSIGIIGIALIMSLSNGFDKKIDSFESDTMAGYPILISKEAMQISPDTIKKAQQKEKDNESSAFPDEKEAYTYDITKEMLMHKNKLSEDYVNYIEKIDPSLIAGISYTRTVNMNLLTDKSGTIKTIKGSNLNFSSLPKKLESQQADYLNSNFDVIHGTLPTSNNQVMLIVDKNNRVEQTIMSSLGFDINDTESFSFDDIVGTTFKLVMNDDYYKELGNIFVPTQDLDEAFNSPDSMTLTISGILRIKEGSNLSAMSSSVVRDGIAYTSGLAEYVLKNAAESQIALKQQESDYNVLSGQKFDLSTEEGIKDKEATLLYLGAKSTPIQIMIYPKDFDSKDEILSYLDAYNANKSDEDTVIYNDLAEIMTTLTGSIMDAITIVLIAFSSISLVVSVIMIGIITYISVIERTKEIGILRALGARKKDISRVFNAETFIIGLTSGLLGITIAWLLLFPANAIILKLADLGGVAIMNPVHAIILITISLLLTLLGGLIPARMAAKRDPVAALRSE